MVSKYKLIQRRRVLRANSSFLKKPRRKVDEYKNELNLFLTARLNCCGKEFL